MEGITTALHPDSVSAAPVDSLRPEDCELEAMRHDLT